MPQIAPMDWALIFSWLFLVLLVVGVKIYYFK